MPPPSWKPIRPASRTCLRGLAGQGLGGKRIGIPAAFHVGVSVDPAAADPEARDPESRTKIEAGAHFVVTEPFYHPGSRAHSGSGSVIFALPVIACVRPLASYREAELLRNEIAGNSIPDSLVERIRDAGSPEAEHREGIRIATETARALREFVQGIMVAGRVENPAQVLEVLEL